MTFNFERSQLKARKELHDRVAVARHKQSHLPLRQVAVECAMEMLDVLESELNSEIEPDGRED